MQNLLSYEKRQGGKLENPRTRRKHEGTYVLMGGRARSSRQEMCNRLHLSRCSLSALLSQAAPGTASLRHAATLELVGLKKCPDIVRRVHVVLPRCCKPFATCLAKYSVEEVAEVFKADFWRCERLYIRCGAGAAGRCAAEVSKLIRALLGGLAVYGCSNSHARGQSLGARQRSTYKVHVEEARTGRRPWPR